MLVGGSIAMTLMAGFGGLATNYGWREAQQEEIDAALRASVSAAAHFMRADLSGGTEEIQQRVAEFMRGLLNDITIDKDDVEVQHDVSTDRTTIRIVGDATFAFRDIWRTADGDGGDSSLVGEQVVVVFEASQYEFALALDITGSMARTPAGWTVTRIQALKDAIRAIAVTVDDVSKTNPGIIAVSLVPFTNMVNVADTSGPAQTAAKERYVHMLTGAEYHTQTSRETEGHWVDTFHAYGSGSDMGPLASRDLPDFLNATDWDLRRQESLDVSAQAPDLGTWNVRGEDFWNGCVMARWGAYWDADARPVVWDPADADNWPAKTRVDGWAPGAAGIRDVPLHMSDQPPTANAPSTRFTAFSWPDGRIHGFADTWLAKVMFGTLDPSRNLTSNRSGVSDNLWRVHDATSVHGTPIAPRGSGAYSCPEAFIVPLTDDPAAIRQVDQYQSRRSWFGQTFMHLGIVWGVRTLSPLWQDIWSTTSVSGDALPRTPCLPGGSKSGCSALVEKAIVLVTDGTNIISTVEGGRTLDNRQGDQPVSTNAEPGDVLCDAYERYDRRMRINLNGVSHLPNLWTNDPATFSGFFDVDADGVFTDAELSAVLDGVQALHPQLSALDPQTNPSHAALIAGQRAAWTAALADVTPWQLFRGHDPTSPSKDTELVDVLVDPHNNFGVPGRPVHHDHLCRPHTPFSAYGRVQDLVNVGDAPPVENVAPLYDLQHEPTRAPAELRFSNRDRLNEWFLESCAFAGQRGVRIHAIYIGNSTGAWNQRYMSLLENCVDLGRDGNPNVDEVRATPTAEELQDALEDIIDTRRNLRFVG